MIRTRRWLSLAVAMVLLLSVSAAWASQEDTSGSDLIVYEDAKVYDDEDTPAAPQPPADTAEVPINTPPPVPAAAEEEAPAADPGEDMPEEEADPAEETAPSGPPAVLVDTPAPDASPTLAPPPTPAPTLPETPDKEMPAPNAQAKAEAIVTASEGAAIFELPSHESAILAHLDSGAVLTVKILGISWTKVESAGQEGYVPTYMLSFGYGSPQPGLAVVTARGGKLTLREKMTTKSKALGSVPSGRAVVLLAKGKTFSLVRHESKEGYVLTAHLEEKTADQNLGMLVQVTPPEGKSSANVRLRAKADRKSASYTTVKSGKSVVVKDTAEGWAAIEYEGYHGFMMADYLKGAE